MPPRSNQSKTIAWIILSAVLVAIVFFVYTLSGATAALVAAGLVPVIFIFVFLPDNVAAWRGVDLKIKCDAAGDEIGLPLVILAFPYRLWQAVTDTPTKNVRGWQAMGGDDNQQESSLDKRRQRLRDALKKPDDKDN